MDNDIDAPRKPKPVMTTAYLGAPDGADDDDQGYRDYPEYEPDDPDDAEFMDRLQGFMDKYAPDEYGLSFNDDDEGALQIWIVVPSEPDEGDDDQDDDDE